MSLTKYLIIYYQCYDLNDKIFTVITHVLSKKYLTFLSTLCYVNVTLCYVNQYPDEKFRENLISKFKKLVCLVLYTIYIFCV